MTLLAHIIDILVKVRRRLCVSSEGQSYLAGLLIVTTGVVVWSTGGLFTRILTVDAATILFWRDLFGALGTCAVMQLLPATRGFRAFGSLGQPGVSYAAVSALAMVLFISSLRLTTVAHVKATLSIYIRCR